METTEAADEDADAKNHSAAAIEEIGESAPENAAAIALIPAKPSRQ